MKGQLFNADSIGDLAAEFAAGVPGFAGADFKAEVMAGLADRELLARLEWIADCLEPRLAKDFPEMVAQLEAAMVPELDPALSDDDFGRFIHAVPGILAVRHGLEQHRERALDLLYEATKRFSMEFYIRAFLNRWPEETYARLARWVGDENYHVRRLVSEGTRPKLPWAKRIETDPDRPLELLDQLQADETRYVTRSVANHLNDLAKIDPEVVVKRLEMWQSLGR
jgi:3-methyladenine DNA glycosylase AlkC